MYKTVYSPEGEMFEVPQHVFDDVILNKGWTQTKPLPAPPTPTKADKSAQRREFVKEKTSAKKAVEKTVD